MPKMPLDAAGAIGKDSRYIERAVATWVSEGARNTPGDIVGGCC